MVSKALGPKIAHGLARCGFGDRLLTAYRMGEAHFRAFLPQWRNDLNAELCTNASGMLPHRCPSATVSSSWPDMLTLTAYLNPVCSALNGLDTSSLALRDRGDLSLPRLAKFCEDHFDEWGHRSRILERFHNFMYEGAVFHILRRAALEADENERTKRQQQGRPGHIREPLRPTPDEAVGTPASLVHRYLDPAKRNLREERLADVFVNRGASRASTSAVAIPDTHPLIEAIVGRRTHLSTDSILEYRVVIRCKQLDDLTNKGIVGKHPEPAPSATQNLPDEDGVYGTGGAKKSRKSIDRSTKRIWVAASIMRQVHPELVQRYETEGAPRVTRRKRKNAGSEIENGDEDDNDSAPEFVDEPSSPVRSQPTPVRKAHRIPAASQNQVMSSPAGRTAGAGRALELPRRPRLLHNVGDINFETPTNRNTFIFTFSDPCDPSMLSEDEELGVPEFVVGPSSQPVQAMRRSSPFQEDSTGVDEPFPTMFTARQEAIIDRALGLIPGGASSRASTQKNPRPRKQSAPGAAPRPRGNDSGVGSSVPVHPPICQPARLSSTQPHTSSIHGSGQAVSSPGPLTNGGSSTTAARNAQPKKTAARAGQGPDDVTSAMLSGGGNNPGLDEPMPVMFSAAQEAIIDRALGLTGGPSQRKAVPTRRRAQPPATQPAEAPQAKKRRTGAAVAVAPPSASLPPLPSSQPSAPTNFAAPRRQIAPFPDLPPLDDPSDRSHPTRTPDRPLRRPIPKERSIIEISDDEAMVKRAPVAPVASRTSGWNLQIPSSSQESRLSQSASVDFDLT